MAEEAAEKEEFEDGEIRQDTLYLYECPEHGLFVDFYEPGTCPECEKECTKLDEAKMLTLIHVTKETKRIEAISLKRE